MQKEQVDEAEKGEFRHLVRVSGVVLDGNLDVVRALTRIKGIGPRISTSVVKAVDLEPDVKLGSLDDSDVERIESGIKDLDKSLPGWMLNRQRDMYTGKNLHLVGPDLEMVEREDINLQRGLKSYKGIRHSLGLPPVQRIGDVDLVLGRADLLHAALADQLC